MAGQASGLGLLHPGETFSRDYERVMGRPGRDYARWVTGHADAFR